MELLVWLLTSYGICFGVQNVLPRARIRYLASLQDCAYCTGFWAGLAALMLLTDFGAHALSWGMLACAGLCSAAFCYAVDKMLHGRW